MKPIAEATAKISPLLPSWAGAWARDSGLLLVSQGLTLAATSASAILIARRLEPSEWGIFSAFLGLSFALAVFVEFGLASWLLRELSQLLAQGGDGAVPEARRITASALSFSAAASAAIVVVGTAAGAVRGQSAELQLTLASLLLYGGLFASSNVLESYLRAQRLLRRVVTASVLEKYVLVTLVVVAFVTSSGVWQIGIAYLAAGLFRFGLLGWSVFGTLVPARPRLRGVHRVLRMSLPFAITSGALTVVPRLDALFLVALSPLAAGYFALGDRLIAPAALVPAIGATALFPFLARRGNRPSAIWTLSGVFSAAGAVVSAVTVLVAPSLVPLVFGSQYADAVPAVRLMLLSLPFIYAANPLLVYSFTYGRERSVVVATLAGALVGTAAIVTGQATVGVVGAAAGLLLRQVLVFCGFAFVAATSARTEQLRRLARSPTAQGVPT